MDMEVGTLGFSILVRFKNRDNQAPEDKHLALIGGNARQMIWELVLTVRLEFGQYLQIQHILLVHQHFGKQ